MSISGAGVLQAVDVWALKQTLNTPAMLLSQNAANAVVNQLDTVNTAIAQTLSGLGQNLDISI